MKKLDLKKLDDKQTIKVFKILEIVITLLYIILGVAIILINQKITLQVVATMAGMIFLNIGVLKILNYFLLKGKSELLEEELIQGLIAFTIGVIILAYLRQTLVLFVILIGIWITYNGLMSMTMSMMQAEQIQSWLTILITSFIVMPAGIIVAAASETDWILIGIILAIYAVMELVQRAILIKNVKKAGKADVTKDNKVATETDNKAE